MELLDFFLNGLANSIYIYFTAATIYVLVFAIAGFGYKKNRNNSVNYKSSIAVFIPAYKEDTVIVEVAKEALKQQYKVEKFDIIVIADSLKEATIQALKALPIILIEVSFKESTKAKALNQALSKLQKNYEYALILDADNVMEPNFLNKLNNAFQKGYQVVQGHRKAKNSNTSFAILDGASEEINNHIFRKGHRALGLSSGLIGSGMGFNYELFKSIMQEVNAIGGFDKELEFKFAKRGIVVEYLNDAIVLDEKIQKANDFAVQRRRWLSTQFIYLKKYFVTGCKELLRNGNINFFDKVLQMIIPPRVLLLGITLLIALGYGLVVVVFDFSSQMMFQKWILNLFLIGLAYLLALPKSFYQFTTLKALLSLPNAFFKMLLLLFKLKGANKKFIHTTHGITQK